MNPVNFAKNRMLEEFRRKRADGVLSLAHDEIHCMAVAKFSSSIASALAEIKGMSKEHVADLAEITGYYHDICRKPIETVPHGVKSAGFFFSDAGNEIFSDMSDKEKVAIELAIEYHEKSFDELRGLFGDPLDIGDNFLTSILVFALKVADGCLEASGFRAVERRSFFVGRERIIQPEGDLKGLFDFPGESDLAVTGETLRRLYGKLTLKSLPPWFRLYGEMLHAIQYRFLAGLLMARNWDELEAAKEIEKRGFPGFEGVVDTVKEQRHLDGGFFKYDEYPVLAEQINNIVKLKEKGKAKSRVASLITCISIATGRMPDEGITALERIAKVMCNDHLDAFVNGIVEYRLSSQKITEEIRQAVLNAIVRETHST